MTVLMVTHDLREAFALGTRVLVFDKVRHDPQAPAPTGRRSPTTSGSTRTAPRRPARRGRETSEDAAGGTTPHDAHEQGEVP